MFSQLRKTSIRCHKMPPFTIDLLTVFLYNRFITNSYI
nr:MAG TPA_asm: hypothetical protein [Caudoviricetes sp.]